MNRESRVTFVCQKCHQPLIVKHDVLDPNVMKSIESADAQNSPFEPGSTSRSTDRNSSSKDTVHNPAVKDVSFGDVNYKKIEPMSDASYFIGSQPSSIGLTQSSAIGHHSSRDPNMTLSPVPSSIVKFSQEGKDSSVDEERLDDISASGKDSFGSWVGQAESVTRYFNLLSSSMNIDHPLCQECANTLLESFERRVNDVKCEYDLYKSFLEKEKDAVLSGDQMNDMKAEIEQLKQEESTLSKSLQQIKNKQNLINQEIKEMESEEKNLENFEDKLWLEMTKFENDIAVKSEQYASVNRRFEYVSEYLADLKKSNVYQDAFIISNDGPFGTINGLRLGRIPDIPVDWTEINAALGQTVLLMQILSEDMHIDFSNYQLVPMGNYSIVKKLGEKQVDYEL